MTMAWTKWPAPAKINLFLHIIGRRADGYHLLQTAFQLLDFCDEIEVKVRDDGRIERLSGAPGVEPADDLVTRAACALQAATGTRLGAELRVHKRIPLGAGLGGGSSDAATTLVALNEVWQTGLSLGALASIGLRLGADVPVFVHGESAYAEGIGEQISRVELPKLWFLVLTPPFHVSTRAVFTDSGLTRNTPPLTIASWLKGIPTHNDCWSVVCRLFPAIGDYADRLKPYGEVALSGTGSSLFVGFPDQAAAQFAKNALSNDSSFIAMALNRSPLLDARDAYRR